MDSSTVALAPILVSSVLHAMVQGTFLAAYAARRARKAPRTWQPFISILKPISGVDEELRENLESFARIDYPHFEILIGIADPDDPAWPVVRAFVADHPRLTIRLVSTDPCEALNPKVAQLLALTRAAAGSVIVVSDANVRVGPQYLGHMLAELSSPGVGLVSSIIVGTGERTFGAAIENAQLSGYILPIVVTAATLARRVITVGKSMMMRKADLDRVGGWQVVADVLAEDDLLGVRFREAGYKVGLSLAPVENRNVRSSVAQTLDRHTRWAKMRRILHPGLFAFEPLLSPALVGCAAMILWPSVATLQATLLALTLQMSTAFLVLWAVRGRLPSVRFALVEVVHPFVFLYFWASAWVVRRVSWRGHDFLLNAATRISLPSGRAVESPGSQKTLA